MHVHCELVILLCHINYRAFCERVGFGVSTEPGRRTLARWRPSSLSSSRSTSRYVVQQSISLLFYSILSLSTMFIYLQLSLSIWHFWKVTFGAKLYRKWPQHTWPYAEVNIGRLFRIPVCFFCCWFAWVLYNSLRDMPLRCFFSSPSSYALSFPSLRAFGTHFKRAPPSPLRAPLPCCFAKALPRWVESVDVCIL